MTDFNKVAAKFRALDAEVKELDMQHALTAFQKRTALFVALKLAPSDAAPIADALGYKGPTKSQFVKVCKHADAYKDIAPIALAAAKSVDDEGKTMIRAGNAYLKALTYLEENQKLPEVKDLLPESDKAKTRTELRDGFAARVRGTVLAAAEAGFKLDAAKLGEVIAGFADVEAMKKSRSASWAPALLDVGVPKKEEEKEEEASGSVSERARAILALVGAGFSKEEALAALGTS